MIIQIDSYGGISLECLMRNNYTWKIEKIKWEHNVEGHKNKNLELLKNGIHMWKSMIVKI